MGFPDTPQVERINKHARELDKEKRARIEAEAQYVVLQTRLLLISDSVPSGKAMVDMFVGLDRIPHTACR